MMTDQVSGCQLPVGTLAWHPELTDLLVEDIGSQPLVVSTAPLLPDFAKR